MPVEWQGDHTLLGDERQKFEGELKRLGFDPGNFLVEVRREAEGEAAGGPAAAHYTVFISDLAHPEHDTCKLHGGPGKDWIGRYAKIVTSHR